MSETHRWEDLHAEFLERTGTDQAEIDQIEQQMRARVRAFRLAEMRRERGLTQREVADAMGVTVARVSQIENGDLTSVDVLSRYAQALGGRLRIMVDFGTDIIAVNG